MICLTVAGCGTTIPECSNQEVKNQVVSYYYEKTKQDPSYASISFGKIVSVKVDEKTRFRNCEIEVIAELTPSWAQVVASSALLNLTVNTKAITTINIDLWFDENKKAFFVEHNQPEWPASAKLIDQFMLEAYLKNQSEQNSAVSEN